MCDFQGYFSKTFQDQSDFPELFRSQNFSRKKCRSFQEVCEHCFIFNKNNLVNFGSIGEKITLTLILSSVLAAVKVHVHVKF